MRIKLVVILTLTLAILAGLPPILWYVVSVRAMRVDGMPGIYETHGAWGQSTLELRGDRTFVQEAKFKNSITGKDEGNKHIQGIWSLEWHHASENRLKFEPFIMLAPWDNQNIKNVFETSYSMMIFGPLLTVSPGAGIYYSKKTR